MLRPCASESLCEFEAGMNTRPNDGRVDRHGNFIIGSYNKSHRLDAHAIGGRGLHTSTSQLNLSRF